MTYHYSNLAKLPCTASNLQVPTLPVYTPYTPAQGPYAINPCTASNLQIPTLPVCTPYTPAQGPYTINPCHNHFDTYHNYYDTCHNPCDGFGFFC